MRLLIGLAIVAAVAIFGHRLFQEGQEAFRQAANQATEAARQATEAARQAADAARDAVQDTAGLVVGGVNVGAELKSLVEQASTTMGNVTDKASAKAALPSLEEVKTRLDGMTAEVEQLPAEGRRLLAGAVSTALPSLKALAERITSVEGGEAIKPTLDAMIGRLESWANAPA